jgi:hypothetical protein
MQTYENKITHVEKTIDDQPVCVYVCVCVCVQPLIDLRGSFVLENGRVNKKRVNQT